MTWCPPSVGEPVKEFAGRSWLWGRRVFRLFSDSHGSLHAAGLTYYSMLALMPILCVLLLLAGILGADDYARRRIHDHFERRVTHFEETVGSPGGPHVSVVVTTDEETGRDVAAQARAISDGLLDQVDDFAIGKVGWIGLLALVWTVLGSIGEVEVSFNEIWGVRRQRTLGRRMLLYAFVAFVLPVLAALAVSFPFLNMAKDLLSMTMGELTATRWLLTTLIWMLDSVIVRIAVALFFSTLLFAFLFKVMPNTRVPTGQAFLWGMVTAILFDAWINICSVAQIGIAQSSALYGSFAILPIVLAWLYVSWQIILLGCCLVRIGSRRPPAESVQLST